LFRKSRRLRQNSQGICCHPCLDHLSYHPENASQEIARFRDLLPKVQAAIAQINATFTPRMEEYAKRLMASNWRPAITEMEAQKQRRLGAVARAVRLVTEARK
jgi:hypothetical protein